MGLDLTIYPLRDRRALSDQNPLCHERLNLDADYQIFGQLIDMGDQLRSERPDIPKPTIRVYPLPPGMWIRVYEDEGIAQRHDDAYGEGLTFAYAGDMAKLSMPTDATAKNRAVKAFIDALPEDTPIILFWH